MIHCCNSIDESFPGWSHSSDERRFFKIPVTPFVCGDMNSNPDFPFGTFRNQCLLSWYLPHVQGAVDRGRIEPPIWTCESPVTRNLIFASKIMKNGHIRVPTGFLKSGWGDCFPPASDFSLHPALHSLHLLKALDFLL